MPKVESEEVKQDWCVRITTQIDLTGFFDYMDKTCDAYVAVMEHPKVPSQHYHMCCKAVQISSIFYQLKKLGLKGNKSMSKRIWKSPNQLQYLFKGCIAPLVSNPIVIRNTIEGCDALEMHKRYWNEKKIYEDTKLEMKAKSKEFKHVLVAEVRERLPPNCDTPSLQLIFDVAMDIKLREDQLPPADHLMLSYAEYVLDRVGGVHIRDNNAMRRRKYARLQDKYQWISKSTMVDML